MPRRAVPAGSAQKKVGSQAASHSRLVVQSGIQCCCSRQPLCYIKRAAGVVAAAATGAAAAVTARPAAATAWVWPTCPARQSAPAHTALQPEKDGFTAACSQHAVWTLVGKPPCAAS